MQPKSRGRISLKSTNPFHWPKMDANYFDHPDDMQTLLEGIKMAVKVGESKSFQKFGSKLHKTPFLGCEGFKFRSDDYWRCCIRRIGASLQHQVSLFFSTFTALFILIHAASFCSKVGTCKMGPSTDPDAVVNPQLQVYGIKGLRVVDASIIPVIPAAHTNAVAFMIGEKGADLVKDFWRNRQ